MTNSLQPRNGLNHDHVHHHYYHPSNPIVKVPVTRAPFVVRVRLRKL